MRRMTMLLGVLVLAACAPAADREDASTPTTEPTTSEAVTDAATTEPPQATSTAPTTLDCDVTPPDGARAETVHAVPMPEGTVVARVQEVDDVEEPLTDVVVYLCSGPLDEDAHRAVATDIAVALHDSPDGEGIGELQVGVWVPGEQQPQRVLEVDDFEMYTWDRDAPRAPETVWES